MSSENLTKLLKNIATLFGPPSSPDQSEQQPKPSPPPQKKIIFKPDPPQQLQ